MQKILIGDEFGYPRQMAHFSIITEHLMHKWGRLTDAMEADVKK
jgi:hypothetical protein